MLIRTTYDDPTSGNSVNLTADLTKGSSTITVASVPSWVTVGNLYVVNETDDSAKILATTDEGSQSYETGRGMGHIVKVTAVTGTTITIELPSPYTYRTANTAHLKVANYNPATHASRKGCGIENINFVSTWTGTKDNHVLKGENLDGFLFNNITSTDSPGGNHIHLYGCYRCEVRHSVFHGTKQNGAGAGYGIAAYQGGGGHLVVDNELYDLHVGVQMNYSTAQSVVAYNYIHGGTASSQQDPGLNQHGIVSHQILWEGNWSEPKYTADDTHGSGGYMSTLFRNVIVGDTAANAYTFDRSCINLRRYCRSFNIVGNILGMPAYHTIYKKQATVDSYSSSVDKAIFVFGYGANGDDDAAAMDVVRHVNYDVVNGDVLGSFTTADLVNSYFLGSKPTFFGNLSWPPYGPEIGHDLSTTAAYNKIPAGYRAANSGVDPSAAGRTSWSGAGRTKEHGGTGRTTFQ
jgi:hypothetical protein